ncbi:unnamed protein product [Danaus chrysippus]|uniref:(African queen) hypothetical protein n=1 Tax=Danaus chrysippus TaxID=151541 RepID=A0A8J2QIV3_9NEOP|nr:unnamed protein product [Danaus chrysippus]
MKCEKETNLKILFLLNFIIKCYGYSNNAGVYGSINVHFNENVPNNRPISQDYYSSGKPESYLPISLSENFFSQPNGYPSKQGSNEEVILVIVEESMDNKANDNVLRPFYISNEQGNYQNNENSHDHKYNDHVGYHQNNEANTGHKPGYYGHNQIVPLVNNNNHGYVVNPLMIGQEIPNSWNDYNKENIEINYIYYQNPNKNNVKPTASTTEPTPITTAAVSTTEYVMKTTKKPDDEPSGLAGDHQEYIYTGDKIYIGGAHTKDTEQKPTDNDEEDFKIDVRFNRDPSN